ncbi:hypothetical protein [Clostridium butyricum]|uniref:hypothetical protein n=1 Tax=Clostridium butyricum TaxID=1492 RepID=UPI0002CB7616|nr:hypothetical protein [Clostridium butyricum]EMU52254.1 hypothetical protein CBDKU1_36860 [Clostridium butyricum DKU-01]MDU4853748.1 hypothetical protein [Clostridioides difficile]
MNGKLKIKYLSRFILSISFILFIGVYIHNYSQNKIDKLNREKREKIIQEQKEKELKLKEYINYISSNIGEKNEIKYDVKSETIYINLYKQVSENMPDLIEKYNLNSESKAEISEKIGLDDLQNEYMSLYNSFISKQRDYEVDYKLNMILKNTSGESDDIFIISDGNISDKIYRDKKESNYTTAIKQTYVARFGQFLECNVNGSTAVVKFKIEPSTSNKTTIDQNGYNIEDMILNQGADKYDEIQYWAVADMTDGSESKVISFTVDKDLISMIKNKQIVGNQIVDYGKDLWILPSLK